MWKAVSDYINRCPPFAENSHSQRDMISLRSCEGSGWIFSTLAQKYLSELQLYEPEIVELVNQYHIYNENYVQSKRNDFSPEPSKDPRILALENRIVAAQAKFLQDNKGKILVPLYTLHGIFVLIALLIVIFRETVGTLVLSPLLLILCLGRVGGKAAKSLHDKV